MYFHSNASLCRDLGLSNKEIKEQVAIGLWFKELSNFMMSKVHIDEYHLYQDLISYERIVSARKTHFRAVPEKNL